MDKIIYKEESYRIIGACMDVHRELGCGFLEQVYQEALEIILSENQIPFSREIELPIIFKGKVLNKKYIADFVCYGKIIIELKAVSELNEIHEAQVFNYLKATDFKLGLLVNFGEKSLIYKRIVI
jgi:GxxExxY protein